MNRSQYQLPSTVLHPNQPTRPFLPSLSANPFRELRNLFCRLPLPTFLHNTIGCSPWRPEAVCSTVMESQLESIAFSRTFCSRIKNREAQRLLYAGQTRLSPGYPIPASNSPHSKRKDNSSFRNKRCLLNYRLECYHFRLLSMVME
jgi:hypothetical protein